MLHELEGRAVDAVARAERRRQHQPVHERWAAAVLEVFVEDVRRVRPQVGTEVLLHLRRGELGEVLGQLVLGVAPGEVRVRLIEPRLGQLLHHLGPGERLG